jgi:hypothetical protein
MVDTCSLADLATIPVACSASPTVHSSQTDRNPSSLLARVQTPCHYTMITVTSRKKVPLELQAVIRLGYTREIEENTCDHVPIRTLNSLVWYVPSLRYTRGLGWRMHCGVEVTESSTNKQHHLSLIVVS